METLLLATFHQMIEGDLNPFMNEVRDFKTLLNEEVENGAKLLSYNHTYFTKDNIEYVEANSYYFKGLHDIYPMHSKHQIRNDKYPHLLTRVSGLPANRKVINTFQYYPGQFELVMETDHTSMDNMESRFYYYNLLLDREYRSVIDTLYRKLFILSDKEDVKKYVSNIQSLLERYINLIDTNFNSTGSSEWHLIIDTELVERDLFKLMKQYLEGMVFHLYTNYRDYLDLERRSYYFLQRIAIKNKYKQIDYIYEALGSDLVDNSLKDVVHEFITSFGDNKSQMPMSSICLFEVLIDRLHVILRENRDRSSTYVSSLVSDAFFREGYNAYPFVFYLVEQHESVMHYLRDPHRIEYLKESIEKYKSLSSTGQLVFNPHYAPVREVLLSWCRNQISNIQDASVPQETFKITFPGTVSELATLFRALKEVGLFGNINDMEFARILSSLFCTERVASISVSSIYNKSRVIDQKAICNVQAHFKTAIDSLERLK